MEQHLPQQDTQGAGGLDGQKKGSTAGAGGRGRRGKGGQETDYMSSFKLEGAKKKAKKKRKELIGIDASGQKTDEFGRIEDRLLSFLQRKQADPTSTSTSAYPESTTSSITASLLSSFQSHPFGSGLFHLRTDDLPTAHQAPDHEGIASTPQLHPSPRPSTKPATDVPPPQPLAISGDAAEVARDPPPSGPRGTAVSVVVSTTPQRRTPSSASPPPLPFAPSSSSSASPVTSHSSPSPSGLLGGMIMPPPPYREPPPRPDRRHRLSHGRTSPEEEEEVEEKEKPAQAMGLFGHALLPPLASASISSSPRGAAAASATHHSLLMASPQIRSWSTPPTTAAEAGGRAPLFDLGRHHQPSFAEDPFSQPNLTSSSSSSSSSSLAYSSPQPPPPLPPPPFAASSSSTSSSSVAQPHRPRPRPPSSSPSSPQPPLHHAHPPILQRRPERAQVRRHRRQLDDEELCLVAEGRERVFLKWRELEGGSGGQGKRRIEELDFEATLRYKLQRIDRLSRRAVPIWTEDAHLNYFSCTSECIRLYVVHSWPSCPLHPLALSEDNLQRFLFSRSGEEEVGTSLALNIYVALALGAILLGDKLRAFTYYKHARQQLSYLFDSSDYSVAEALFGLTYIAFSKGSMKKAMYYTTLAMQICRHLNAFHSSVYNRCLMSLFFVPTTTMAEKKRLWDEYTAKIATLPYYDEGRLHMFDIGGTPGGGGDEGGGGPHHHHHHFIDAGENKIGTTASMRNNIKQAKVIDRIARNSMAIYLTFHALDQKCEEKKQELEPTRQDVLIKDLFTDTDEMKNVFEVLNVLVGKCKLVEELLRAEQLPVSLKAGTEIALLALYGELNRRLGRTGDALKWAKRCLNTMMLHEVQYLPVGILSSLIMVINIFLTYRKYHHVLLLLQTLRPMALAYPSVQFLQKSYLDRLKAACAQERIEGIGFDDGRDRRLEADDSRRRRAAVADDEPASGSKKEPMLPYPHPLSESDGDEGGTSPLWDSGLGSDGGSVGPTSDDAYEPPLAHHTHHRHHQQQHHQHHMQQQRDQRHRLQQEGASPLHGQHQRQHRQPLVHHNPPSHQPRAPDAAYNAAGRKTGRPASLPQERPWPTTAAPQTTDMSLTAPPRPPPAEVPTYYNGGQSAQSIAPAPMNGGQWQQQHSMPRPDVGAATSRPAATLEGAQQRERGGDFIAKLRRWMGGGAEGALNLETMEDLMDEFTVFLEEADLGGPV